MTTKKKSIDHSLVRDLADILNDTDLTEIEFEQDDFRIRVSRTPAPTQVVAAAPAAAAPVAAAPMVMNVTNEAPAAPASRGFNVPSPMVGTAYLSPSPDEDAFLKVGQTVKEGQTLLIIEAMKTMNQIPSPKSGKIVEITAEDGQPVEFGDTLVIIE